VSRRHRQDADGRPSEDQSDGGLHHGVALLQYSGNYPWHALVPSCASDELGDRGTHFDPLVAARLFAAHRRECGARLVQASARSSNSGGRTRLWIQARRRRWRYRQAAVRPNPRGARPTPRRRSGCEPPRFAVSTWDVLPDALLRRPRRGRVLLPVRHPPRLRGRSLTWPGSPTIRQTICDGRVPAGGCPTSRASVVVPEGLVKAAERTVMWNRMSSGFC